MSDPVIYCDFLNHVYQLNGAAVMMSDIIQQTLPVPLGSIPNIYPGTVGLSGNGLICSGTPTHFNPTPPNGSYPVLTSAALAALNAGGGTFSMIIQYSQIVPGPGVIEVTQFTTICSLCYTNPPDNTAFISMMDINAIQGPTSYGVGYGIQTPTDIYAQQTALYVSPPGQTQFSFAFTPPNAAQVAANTSTITPGTTSAAPASHYYFVGFGGWAAGGPNGNDTQNGVSIQFIGIYTNTSGGGGGTPPPPPPPTPAPVVLRQPINATIPTPLVVIPCCHTEAPICHCT